MFAALLVVALVLLILAVTGGVFVSNVLWLILFLVLAVVIIATFVR